MTSETKVRATRTPRPRRSPLDAIFARRNGLPPANRNPGTGANPLTTSELVPNTHTVSHAAGASFIVLPVID